MQTIPEDVEACWRHAQFWGNRGALDRFWTWYMCEEESADHVLLRAAQLHHDAACHAYQTMRLMKWRFIERLFWLVRARRESREAARFADLYLSLHADPLSEDALRDLRAIYAMVGRDNQMTAHGTLVASH